jgi:hypothetical protein
MSEEKKVRAKRAAQIRPVYVLYSPEIDAQGKINNLGLTRDPNRAMEFLTTNPGAKVEKVALV